MKNEFIPFEEALALKELGFDKGSFAWYFEHNKEFGITNKIIKCDGKDISAPLYSQAFRWFREEHGLWVTFEYYDCDCVDDDICWYIGKCFREGIGPLFLTNELGDFKTKEEAELACLRKLIEIVRNENE